MRNLKLAVAAAFVCSGLAVSAANATEATNLDCRNLAEQVKAALDGNQQSSNYDDAMKAKRSGMTYCAHGRYKPGVAYYEQALKLLGVSKG